MGRAQLYDNDEYDIKLQIHQSYDSINDKNPLKHT